MYRIDSIQPGEGYTLHLTYTDGATVHADLSGLMARPGVFAPLTDRAFFEQVHTDRRGRVITWPGELDLDPDVFRMDDDDPNKPDGFRTLSRTAGREPDPVSQEVARAVRDSGLKQGEVAERAGMQQPNVARLMDPDYHGHSVSALRRVAEAMNLQLAVGFVATDGLHPLVHEFRENIRRQVQARRRELNLHMSLVEDTGLQVLVSVQGRKPLRLVHEYDIHPSAVPGSPMVRLDGTDEDGQPYSITAPADQLVTEFRLDPSFKAS